MIGREPWIEEVRFACPYCGREAGRRCHTRGGLITVRPHGPRTVAWIKTLGDRPASPEGAAEEGSGRG